MRRAAALVRGALAATAFLGLALSSSTSEAHLIAEQKGTLNVVGDAVFVVLSVPTSALGPLDDDGDGRVDLTEFQRHEAALQGQIAERLQLFDGPRRATLVRVDLVLSPRHEASAERGDQIVALQHVRFEAPPSALRLHCDLFGTGAAERSLSFTATRRPGGQGTPAESQTTVLTPGAPEHAFFAPAAEHAPPATSRGTMAGALPRGALPATGLFTLVLAISWASRSRSRRAARAPA